jgi:5'-nucleotidase
MADVRADDGDERGDAGPGVRVLITNDDGIESLGLRVLAEAALAEGLDVVVAAPSWDASGSAASLTAVEEEGRFLVDERTIPGMPDVPAYAVEAAPAFIVRAGIHGAYGPQPDVVLSGINLGVNTGHAVIHSGTVGAALTAATYGLRALAVSLAVDRSLHWDTAGELTRRVLPWLLTASPGTVLNLNVPARPAEEVRGLRRAALSRTGTVQANVTELDGGYVRLAYTPVEEEAEPGTDAALLAEGYASLTPLLGPCEARAVDMSDLDSVLAGRT